MVIFFGFVGFGWGVEGVFGWTIVCLCALEWGRFGGGWMNGWIFGVATGAGAGMCRYGFMGRGVCIESVGQ